MWQSFTLFWAGKHQTLRYVIKRIALLLYMLFLLIIIAHVNLFCLSQKNHSQWNMLLQKVSQTPRCFRWYEEVRPLNGAWKSDQNGSNRNQSAWRQCPPKVRVHLFHSQDDDWFWIFWAFLVPFGLGIMWEEGFWEVWIFALYSLMLEGSHVLSPLTSPFIPPPLPPCPPPLPCLSPLPPLSPSPSPFIPLPLPLSPPCPFVPPMDKTE